MAVLDAYTFWIGWDPQIQSPVVIHGLKPGSGTFYSCRDCNSHGRNFLYFEKRYGPMRKMEVTNLDGYGEEIA